MINEKLAKLAHTNSFTSDYIENSQTKMWERKVQEAKEVLEKVEHLTEEQREYSLERYKKKTSEWINSKSSADANHVSWFIAGRANYNMKKHEQWKNKIDKLFSSYDYTFNIKNYYKEPRNEIKQDIEEKEYEFCGITVIHNIEENRLQLMFEGKPEESVRKILKKNGFNWSPRYKVWQRQLTKNALSAFERIKNDLVGGND